MDQPPLIDIEPEHGGKSSRGGCGGCIGKLIPMLTVFMLLALILMSVAWFIWGKGLGEDEGSVAGAGADGVVPGETVKEEKTGFAGLMEKAKKAIKGEPTPKKEEVAAAEQAGAGNNGMQGAVDKSTALAESIGAEAQTPEQRNQALKDKFGHMEQNRPEGAGGEGVDLSQAANQQGGVTELAENLGGVGGPSSGASGAGAGGGAGLPDKGIQVQRGGSYGSSTGTAVAGGKDNSYLIWRGDLGTSGSDLQFEIIYRQAGSQLHFRCFLMPYDSETARLLQGDKGDLLVSFHGLTSEQLVPKKEAYSLPLIKMSAFEARGEVAGWVARGVIPMEGMPFADLSSVKLAWDFDEELSDWLKELKRDR